MNELEHQKMNNYLSSAAKIIAKTEGNKIKKTNYNTSSQINEDFDYGAQFENQILGSYEQTYAPINTGGLKPAASKLPKEILESVMSNPISDFNSMNGLSVLDSLPIQRQQPKQQMNENFYPGEKEMSSTEELLARSRALREQTHPQPAYNPQPTYQSQPNMMASSNNIDYSMIRMIIEDCISKKFDELKRTMLNENTSKGSKGDVILTIGDNIKFIAKNGNVYEGVVKKVGNINSQK